MNIFSQHLVGERRIGFSTFVIFYSRSHIIKDATNIVVKYQYFVNVICVFIIMALTE